MHNLQEGVREQLERAAGELQGTDVAVLPVMPLLLLRQGKSDRKGDLCCHGQHRGYLFKAR